MFYSVYKVIEIENVTAERLEQQINEVVSEGWELDAIQFVVPEGHRRPSMAFVFFTDGTNEETFEEEETHEHTSN